MKAKSDSAICAAFFVFVDLDSAEPLFVDCGFEDSFVGFEVAAVIGASCLIDADDEDTFAANIGDVFGSAFR